MSTERKAIGLGLLSIAGAIEDAQYMPGQVAGDPDDIERLNQAFVRGEITLNIYIAKLEKLQSMAAPKEERDR